MMGVKVAIFVVLFGWSVIPNTSAEVSVSGQHGPVRLTLTLYSNKVRVGEPVWYRVTLTNIGKQPLGIYESAFCSDKRQFMKTLKNHYYLKRGLLVVVTDANGKRMEPYFRLSPQGGSSADIKHEIVSPDYKALPEQKESENHVPWPEYFGGPLEGCPSSALLPGQSQQTPVWVFEDFRPGERSHIPRSPGHFAEMIQFEFEKAGRYRIYASFDTTLARFRTPDRKFEELLRKSREAQDPPEVVIRVRTRPMTLDVLP